MKFYQQGDKGSALCPGCAQRVSTTFQRRDVPFNDGKGLARGILAAVCDQCDQVVGIPAQSTPAIREARPNELVALDANLPAVYIDMLDMAVHLLDPSASTQLRKVLLAYFLNRLAHDANTRSELQAAHVYCREHYAEPRGVPRRRLSMKLSPRIAHSLDTLLEGTGLSQTELLKCVIVQIEHDVVSAPKPELVKILSDLCAAIA